MPRSAGCARAAGMSARPPSTCNPRMIPPYPTSAERVGPIYTVPTLPRRTWISLPRRGITRRLSGRLARLEYLVRDEDIPRDIAHRLAEEAAAAVEQAIS